jgi:hypothetical protein
MKRYLIILFTFSSVNLCAQQDDYFLGFCRAYDELLISHELYLSDTTALKIAERFETITQQYHTLLKIYDEVCFKYRKDIVFDTVFAPRYVEVLDEVDMLLEADVPLRSLKNMVRTMVNIERDGFPKKDREVETSIRLLHFQDFYRNSFFQSTIEGMSLKKQLSSLEAYIYKKYFNKPIKQIKTAPLTEEYKMHAEDLKLLLESSSCRLCREQASRVLLDFYRRLQAGGIAY